MQDCSPGQGDRTHPLELVAARVQHPQRRDPRQRPAQHHRTLILKLVLTHVDAPQLWLAQQGHSHGAGAIRSDLIQRELELL